MRTLLSLLLLAASAAPAAAAQYHVPLHVPPRAASDEVKDAQLLLAFGYAGASAAGLEVDGPAGSWEIAVRMSESWSAHVHSDVFAFGGSFDTGRGRRETGGFTGALEGDLAKSWGPWRAYAGMQVSMSLIDLANPAVVTVQGGALRLEPTTAFSMVVGFPLGIGLHGGEEWRFSADAFVTPSPGGGTFFGYGAAGPPLTKKTLPVHAFVSTGARLRVERPSWRVGLEGGASVSSSSGNNEAVTSGYGALTVRLF